MESISAEFPLLFLPLSSAAAVASRRVAAKIGNLNAGVAVAVAVGCSGEGEGRARPTFRSLFHDRDRSRPSERRLRLSAAPLLHFREKSE